MTTGQIDTPSVLRDSAISLNADHNPFIASKLWLVRHGETEWSISGQHTGRTDLPLIAAGEERAKEIRRFLNGRRFALVLTSPLRRAIETCRLAGYGDNPLVDSNLREWDYGEYEGRTTTEILRDRPRWCLWTDGVPGGETIEQVAARDSGCNRSRSRCLRRGTDICAWPHSADPDVMLVGLGAAAGRLFALGTASVCTLGYQRDARVITRWNSALCQ